jgi:D-alanyl-D-alanine carboxypeptidase/D-alanyl-D-alanine-endopeptidase (penicillin-binding protein 4)
MPFRFYFFCVSILTLVACVGTKKSARTTLRNLEIALDTSPVFSQSLTGFYLMDALSGNPILSRNADHYFTPASSTKILTLATCLKVLGDSLTGITYAPEEGTLNISGTADPTFLHPQFEYWQPVYQFLASQKNTTTINYSPKPFTEKRFGAGWCWDDYDTQYQSERSIMPIFGNCFEVELNPITQTGFAKPAYFSRYKSDIDEATRAEFSTHWTDKNLPTGEVQTIPFVTSENMVIELLKDTLPSLKIVFTPYLPQIAPPKKWTTIQSCPVDTVYRWMMYESDNFFAEQLLIMASMKALGVTSQDSIVKWSINQAFPPSSTPPRWVDGSGLSRYNLVTPRYLCQVLDQLYHTQNQDRLFSLFPAGGLRGTIKEWYNNDTGKPYIFAKTGSMSGVHCLSGYIVTKSGKILIFSFMHNNFRGSNKAWKIEMQRILAIIWEQY